MSLKQSKYYLFFPIAIVLLALLFLMSLMYGTVDIPYSGVFDALTGNPTEKRTWEFIILEFRLPKAITAVLAGAALSVSGLLMQTLFRNPLAGPYVLGISNGASLGVALLVLTGGVFFGNLIPEGSWGVVIAAVLGSAMILSLVMLVSIKVKDNVSLLIIGLMVGSATGAIVSVLQYFGDPEVIQAYLVWTFGSLAGTNWEQMEILVPIVLFGLILAFLSQKALNALLLGEEYARGLGISVKSSRAVIIISTCLLAGGITAFCGPVAFIGLAVPHIARAALNTSNHKILIPSSILIGSILLLGCDLIAQLPGNVNTLPINAITALIGAPVVIWVVIKARNIKSSF